MSARLLNDSFRTAALAALVLSAPLAADACDAADAIGPHFCLLSQIGGCAALPQFLADRLPPAGPGIFPGTLIVDAQCELKHPIVLPRRMTLAGVGIGGEGMLYFPTLTASRPAISIHDDPQQPNGSVDVTIRDLAVYGPGADGVTPSSGVGLDLLDDHQVTLNRVRISNFFIGVLGRNAYSVSIVQSNVSNNGYNLVLRKLGNTWRVRDSILSQAAHWSVYVQGGNDVLLDGNRFESNAHGGVRVRSHSTLISNNRFEMNGTAPDFEGIRIEHSGEHTRVLSNVFSTSAVTNLGSGTECQFNVEDPAFPIGC